MVHIAPDDLSQWLDSTKFTIDRIEPALEGSVATVVLSQLAKQFPSDVSGWTNEVTTPDLVRTVIAVKFAAILYRRQYSEVTDKLPPYAAFLDKWGEMLLHAVLDGSTDLLDVTPIPASQQPDFYPNDQSSARVVVGSEAAALLLEQGAFSEGEGVKFRMGQVF